MRFPAYSLTVAKLSMTCALMFSGEMARAAESAPLLVAFSGESLEIPPSDAAKLQELAARASHESSVVVHLEMPSAGAKATSIGAITARTRALKIFQALVNAGVDPGHIELAAVAAKGRATRQIKVTSATSTEVPATHRLKPSPHAEKEGAEDYRLTFASASAVPEIKDQQAFEAFLQGVGQPGHDALTIEGHTDSSGSPAYNAALAELRALSVYEVLVKAGVPPYRIATRGVANAKPGAPESAAVMQAARSVTVHWVSDPQIAKVAAAQEQPKTPPPEPAPAEPKPAEPPPSVAANETPSPPPPPQPAAGDTKTLELIAGYGGAFGGGMLQHKAKPGRAFVLGLDTEFLDSPTGKVRATLEGGATRFGPRERGMSGPLNLRYGLLRTDYVFKSKTFVRPYAGVGLGLYLWKVDETQTVTSVKNSGDKRDGGWLVAAGLDIPVHKSLTLAPELTWNRIMGTFNEQVWTAWLALRCGV